MRNKRRWLAEAKFGTLIQKKQLMSKLRITHNRDGSKCDPETAFNNSVRGFYAEEVARLYLEFRREILGRDYRWDDDGIVYEVQDIDGERKSEPDGSLTLKDGSEASFDVKGCKCYRTRPFVDEDGICHRTFNRTHNAQFILWYDEDEHELHLCKRLSPLYDQGHVWDNAEYDDFASFTTKEEEKIVDGVLKGLL